MLQKWLIASCRVCLFAAVCMCHSLGSLTNMAPDPLAAAATLNFFTVPTCVSRMLLYTRMHRPGFRGAQWVRAPRPPTSRRPPTMKYFCRLLGFVTRSRITARIPAKKLPILTRSWNMDPRPPTWPIGSCKYLDKKNRSASNKHASS